MRAVPTSKTLTNPQLVHRQVYIWQPFLDKPYFPSRRRQFQELYELTLAELSTNPISALELEHVYNEELSSRVSRQKDKVVIYTTGISVDQTPPDKAIPKRLGIDPMSDRNRLSSSIQHISKELCEEWLSQGKEFPLDMFVYVPLAPVIFPYQINQCFEVEHFDTASIEAANEMIEEKGKRTFGDTVKTLENDFRLANYKFSPALFDTKLAKIFYQDIEGEELEKVTTFNRYLFANVLAFLLSRHLTPDARHPKGMINVYAERSSYAFHVTNLARRILEDKYGINSRLSDLDKIMRNTEFSREAECDPRALSILKGFLNSVAATMV